MTENTIYHWVKVFQFGNGIDAVSECGLSTKDFPNMKGCSNHEILVNCPKCKEKFIERQKGRTQKLCSFCVTPLADEDYENPNDFYLSCFQHKRLAQIETEKFFKQNPDYTKWHKASV